MERLLVLLAISAASIMAAPMIDPGTWKRYSVSVPKVTPIRPSFPDSVKSVIPW